MNETIKINGIEYPIVFGWNAIRKFSDESKVSVTQIEYAIVNRMDYALLAIYIGIAEGYRKQQKPFDLTIDDFVDLFDADPGAITDAIAKMAKQLKMIVSKVAGKQTKKTAKSKNVKAPKP